MIRTTMVLIIFAFSTTFGSGQEPDSNPPEQVVLQAVESYVAAFNNRDANAVSQHWSVSGEYIDHEGNRVRGQESIRQAFDTVFSQLDDDQSLTVTVNRIAFVTPDVAMEEGTARLGDQPATEYVAIHKLENGHWNLFRIKESSSPAKPTANKHLQELEWLIGDWKDQSESGTVDSSCHWSRNGNFLSRNFRVSVPGMDRLEGTQVIGYDATAGAIRSWTFDSDGGIATGQWVRVGESWEVQVTHALADGRQGSAFNIYTPRTENHFSWRSVKRSVDGQPLEDVPQIDVFRVMVDSASADKMNDQVR